MFTGIVQGKALIKTIAGDATLKTLTICFPAASLAGVQRGASIAINGVCLTVTAHDEQNRTARFDVMTETLAKTNLDSLQVGTEVNFERAARIGDEIGGHLMSGHVHTSVAVSRVVHETMNCTIYFKTPLAFLLYLLPKGFVGLNGCSLTLGTVSADEFCVHLIPETLSVTTFGQVRVGDRVNLEIDSQTQAIVDTVERVLKERLR